MKKIIIFLITLLSPLIVNASPRFDEEINILENGDLHIRQSIAIDGSYNGFNLSLKYKYFDENAIYSADDIEVIKVCESNKEAPLNDVGECFEQVSFAEKGDSLVYTQADYGDSTDFMFYNPSYREKAFYIEYKLKNVIVAHNDVAELRLNLIDDSFTEYMNTVNVIVNLPKAALDLRAWAHGPLWGDVVLDPQKNYAQFIVSGYEAGTATDIRMTFDNSLVNTSKKTGIDKLASIIAEETELANEANAIRQEVQEKIEAENRKERLMTNIFYAVALVWVLIEFYVVYGIYHKFDKEYKSSFDGKYFRDFPSEHSPETIQYLMKKNIDSDGLSASLLNIIYKKGLKIKQINEEKGLIIKKQVKEYVLCKNDENLKEPLTEQENVLRNWFLSDFGNGEEFELTNLKRASRSEKSARKFIDNYNDWIRDAKTIAESENFFEKGTSFKFFGALFSLIPLFLVYVFVRYTYLVFILLIIGIIAFFYIVFCSKKTQKGIELFMKWKGLKNFINDFGNFSKRELPEIALWEKYLVYATMFGIADKLRKQMEIIVPNISDFSDGLSARDYFIINDIINNNVISNVNAAIASSHAKIVSSNASSGSGYGGGFSGGGGGGFSGGGGSGGGRF